MANRDEKVISSIIIWCVCVCVCVKGEYWPLKNFFKDSMAERYQVLITIRDERCVIVSIIMMMMMMIDDLRPLLCTW